MRIGIVLHPYGEDAPAGLGRAIYEITRSLIELDRENEYVVFLRHRPKTPPQFAGTNWRLKISNERFFWLDWILRGERLDVCIFNTPIMPLVVRPKKSIVITYDYAYFHFGRSLLTKFLHGLALGKADHIAAISEYTKKETIALFHLAPQKISVIYLGFNNLCRHIAEKPPPMPGKFFLFVGVMKERKNLLGVVKAFAEFKRSVQSPHKLLVVGKGSGAYVENIQSYIAEHDLGSEVVFVGRVSDGDLAHYYQHAEALVFPSFIEGFGFTVLEAFACGTPVITSITSSLPEVAGDAALLVDPTDTGAITRAMKRLVEEPGLRQTLIEKSRLQLQKFSWENTAKHFLQLIT